MKFLLVLLTTSAFAAASVINRRNLGLMDDGIIMMDQNEVYDDVSPFKDTNMWKTMLFNQDKDMELFGDVAIRTYMDKFGLDTSIGNMYEMNPMLYNTITGMRRMSWPMMNMGIDKRTTDMMMIKILMKMFDQKVMMHLLNLYGMDQTQNEMVLDKILITEGIFDKRVLMELIHDTFLRNLMIKHRIFDTTLMETNREVTFDELEQFINRQVLKNWMTTFGCCNKDILRRMVHETIIEKLMTTEKMDRLWLMKVMEDSMLTRFLVQRGIFNVNILEKCLFNLRRNMMTGDDLLKQLINRRLLKVHLMEKGFIDITLLDRLMENEILGLKVLLNILTLDQTPNMTYKQIMGMVINKPEWMFGKTRTFSVGDDLFGITMNRKNLMPFINGDFDTNRYRTFVPYNFWNTITGRGVILITK
ncbi:hypothetical protein WA026_012108 [Henosepilachna vigintioctopunctata]|uniref:Uncharacterized protein n=1 Tax=Henosepilachna vigintioctopunctata TaxID=420089 RepID=A0AAW1VE29_9CUCU